MSDEWIGFGHEVGVANGSSSDKEESVILYEKHGVSVSIAVSGPGFLQARVKAYLAPLIDNALHHVETGTPKNSLFRDMVEVWRRRPPTQKPPAPSLPEINGINWMHKHTM